MQYGDYHCKKKRNVLHKVKMNLSLVTYKATIVGSSKNDTMMGYTNKNSFTPSSKAYDDKNLWNDLPLYYKNK